MKGMRFRRCRRSRVDAYGVRSNERYSSGKKNSGSRLSSKGSALGQQPGALINRGGRLVGASQERPPCSRCARATSTLARTLRPRHAAACTTQRSRGDFRFSDMVRVQRRRRRCYRRAGRTHARDRGVAIRGSRGRRTRPALMLRCAPCATIVTGRSGGMSNRRGDTLRFGHIDLQDGTGGAGSGRSDGAILSRARRRGFPSSICAARAAHPRVPDRPAGRPGGRRGHVAAHLPQGARGAFDLRAGRQSDPVDLHDRAPHLASTRSASASEAASASARTASPPPSPPPTSRASPPISIPTRPTGPTRLAAAGALAALAKLPDNQRQALILTKVHGRSVADAAMITGSTPGAIKQRAHRAYVTLRQMLGRETTRGRATEPRRRRARRSHDHRATTGFRRSRAGGRHRRGAPPPAPAPDWCAPSTG